MDANLPARQPDLFASTHWSVVLAAGSASTECSRAALDQLCRAYWRPLYVYLRHKGHPPEDAEDLTQSFFAQLLEHRAFEGLDRAQGRFRAFLLACLKNYLSNDYDKRQAQRRGGGWAPLSLDFAGLEQLSAQMGIADDSPDRAYDRQWATLVLERVMHLLRKELEKQGKTKMFDALKPALTGDRLDDSYAAIGRRFGLTESALKVAVHRLRRRYRALLRAEIAQTVASPEDVEREIRELLHALS